MRAQRFDGLPRYPVLALFLACLLYALPAQSWEGKVVGLTDGDTIKVLHDKIPVKVRLYGMDCPEKRQAFGTKAKQFTSDLVFGNVVDVEAADVDRYRRTVGIVRLPDGTVVNQEILRAGFCWVYAAFCKRPMCSEWKMLEGEAATGKLGLWRGEHPLPPWEWRRMRRSPQVQ